MQYDPVIDVLKSLMWGDVGSHIEKIGLVKQALVDEYHTEFWNNFLVDVFNFNTANSFGLSVWARILDVPLYLSSEARTEAFGFNGGQPFGQAAFNVVSGTPIAVSLEEQRQMIKLKYFIMTNRLSIPSINAGFAWVFGAGNVTVESNHNMTMTITVFNESISEYFINYLSTLDLLLIPAAVDYNIVYKYITPFGFDGGEPFGQGAFFKG